MRVLVVHDEPDVRSQLWRQLARGGHEVVDVADLEQVNARLLRHENTPVVVIGVTAGGGGLDELQRLRASQESTFILAVVADNAPDERADAYRAGADVVMTVASSTTDLLSAMHAAERAAQRDNVLREQTARDPLTGVLNRRAALAAINVEMARTKRLPLPFCLAMADLDNFKRVNDRFGHPVGDEVLLRVVERLRGVIRSYDVLGRWGGEEFVIALPSCTLAAGAEAAERMRAAIAKPLLLAGRGPAAITVSIGVAEMVPGEQATAEDLVAAADRALYRAKNRGRNRVELGTVTA